MKSLHDYFSKVLNTEQLASLSGAISRDCNAKVVPMSMLIEHISLYGTEELAWIQHIGQKSVYKIMDIAFKYQSIQ